MSTMDLLRANFERLMQQYNTNVHAILALQATLIRDILPSVSDELELGPDATEWAKEWLEDTYTIFRISRRNKFTRSFALESIRKNLVWRLGNLWPLGHPGSTPMLHCLPESACDPFGRPIVLVEVLPLDITSKNVKSLILHTFERLRRHLKAINTSREASPVLQYIVLVDLKGMSLKSFDVEILSWTVREVIPRYPGMLGGVFMVNYSWVHSGLWSIVKRVLPASALSRVFFPSNDELIQYFTRSSLPEDYGGTLAPLALLDDPLRTGENPLEIMDPNYNQIRAADPLVSPLPASTSLSPTSHLNPFFGYPASSSYGSLSLHHGRRRKRDLAQTLAVLFWMRWRKPLVVGIFFTVCAIVFKVASRGARVRSLRIFLGQKWPLSFKLGSK